MATVVNDLRAEIDDLARRFPHLSKQDRFVLWFQTAAITGEEELAAKSLCGGAHDKGIDAVHVDDDARTVFITQGKLRDSDKAQEARNDILALARVATSTKAAPDAFKVFASGMAADIRSRVDQARKRVLERQYRLVLYYATTGRVSAGLKHEAERSADEFEAELTVFDGKAIGYLLRDYVDGIAPPVPSMDLGLESGEALSRHDPATGIEAWVVSAPASEVAHMFQVANVKIFARNVRGYMGATRINDAMKATLQEEPVRFWYLNNGITIVCSAAKRESTGGRSLLRIRNPQIINGEQTTRVLSESAHGVSPAAVLVRVIAIPSDNKTLYDELVSRIVRASNSQNQIKESDLIANDGHQIRLERELRNLGYLYLRKREPVGDAKARLGIAVFRTVRKEEVAQAVAATIVDPYVVRSGKEGLFRDEHYELIFKHTTVQILCRWWFMQRIRATQTALTRNGLSSITAGMNSEETLTRLLVTSLRCASDQDETGNWSTVSTLQLIADFGLQTPTSGPNADRDRLLWMYRGSSIVRSCTSASSDLWPLNDQATRRLSTRRLIGSPRQSASRYQAPDPTARMF